MSLTTDADRRLVAQARDLAAITGDDARERAGTTDLAAAYAIMFGDARHLLGELAAIIERLGGHG